MLPVYEQRPFKVRNAEEIDSVLDLFVDPQPDLRNPFDYENQLVKGRMGSGKTMYLRANCAFYWDSLVPSLLEGGSAVLPLYVRLSDFQQFRDPDVIYKQIIIAVVESLCGVHRQLADGEALARTHQGIRHLPDRTSSEREILSRVTQMRPDAPFGMKEST